MRSSGQLKPPPATLPNAGMAELYCPPFTVIGPLSPYSAMRITRSSEPTAHSEPARGGIAGGCPAPLTIWHVTQAAWLNHFLPSATGSTVAVGAAATAPGGASSS